MRIALLAVLALCACGRLQFSRLDDAGGGDGPNGDVLTSDVPMSDGSLPTAGLVAHFAFEDNFIENVSATAGACQPINCPLFAAGQVGKAVDLDGLDDCLTFSTVAAIETPQITLALWVSHEITTNVSLLAKPLSTGSSNSWQLETDYGNMNNLAVSFVVANNFTNELITTPLNTIVIGTWQHIAATYDGSLKRLYVDGVERITGSHPSLDYDGKPLKIGCDDNGSGNTIFFNGQIDEVRIYDRALSASEIGQLAGQ